MAETTVRKNTKKKEVKALPSDAEIISKDVTVDVDEIENGYLITKRTSIRWKAKGSKESYGDWFENTEKYFSKEDPLTITTEDKALADMFDEDE